VTEQTPKITPQPKPPSRLVAQTARVRDGKRAEFAFKRAVWDRDEGRCRACGCRCVRTLSLHPRRGDAHHFRRRGHRPTRFDPRNGLLLCAEDHERVTTHRLDIYATEMFVVGSVAYFDMSGPLHFVHSA